MQNKDDIISSIYMHQHEQLDVTITSHQPRAKLAMCKIQRTSDEYDDSSHFSLSPIDFTVYTRQILHTREMKDSSSQQFEHRTFFTHENQEFKKISKSTTRESSVRTMNSSWSIFSSDKRCLGNMNKESSKNT